MNEEMIRVIKKPGVKDCIRINSQNDIPDFLKEVIKIEGNILIIDSLEGKERCPLGSVIAFEKLKNGKMNVWNKANWKETTREINGVFYELTKPYFAVRITDTIPQSIIDGLGDKFTVLPTGEFQIKTDWGVLKCAPSNGYIIIYGKKEDGSLDANFLTKGTPSFSQYFVIDDSGNIVESLEDYDNRLIESKSSGISVV